MAELPRSTTRRRVGRMPVWQRWASWLVLGGCLASGAVYLLLLDWVDVGPARVRFWWIAHGVSSLLAMVVFGGALAQHVRATWQARRGRVSGSTNLVLLAVLVVSALLLFYGLQAWHEPARQVHWVVGLAALLMFPAHVLWGRTRPGR